MKKLILPVIILLSFKCAVSQSLESKYYSPGTERSSGTISPFLKTLIFVLPVNPILMIENKKFYAGVTKEFSVGRFPYGRAAVEYSLIFRETKVNQLRASYNYDIPLSAGDFAALLLSVGGGYFTDFDKTGYFPQLSFGLLLSASDHVGVQAYAKVRDTFVTDDNRSDIFDCSFGFGTSFYF